MIDYVIIVFTSLHLLCIIVELSLYKHFLGKGVDLDRRVKLSETNRIKENSRYYVFSAAIFVLIFIIPKFVSKKQPCNYGFYN